MKMLIAEDDTTSRAMLEAICRQWGFDPIVAENGEQAWQIIRQPRAPKLLLLDWEMPGYSGLELCQMIAAQALEEPPYVILVTARSSTRDIVEGLEQGANDYITKPFSPDEMRARLRVGKRMLEIQQELADVRRNLAYQASHDQLTQLMNRRAIVGQLKAKLNSDQCPFTIALCDLDHFKRINDTLGHEAGDRALTQTAKILSSLTESTGHVGRYGGEEFLLILDGSKADNEPVLEQIRATIAHLSAVTNGEMLPVTASFGAMEVGSDPQNKRALLAQVDRSLYQAKRTGRNRVVWS